MNNSLERNNVIVSGQGNRTLIFAHGYGCDQNMWRFVAPAFEQSDRVVLFDHVGFGRSDIGAYDAIKYGSLDGYATDVIEIARALDIRDGVFIGHSVSSMIGILASNRAPELFSDLVLVGPSPRYIDDIDYVGGFSSEDIDQVLDSLESNYLGWSRSMAPVIMGNPERPALAEELANSFCRTDPAIARQFAEVTFRGDNRKDLPHLQARALVLQCADDVIAPIAVGRYVHHALPRSEFGMLQATGHCPNLSAPAETIEAIRNFL